MKKSKTKIIVLTGGPCSGKTSALKKIRENLEILGYNVVTIPEAATELITSGISFTNIGKYEFQKKLLEYQLQKEDIFISSAKKLDRETVVVCDRGALDIKAYIDKDGFNKILQELSLSEDDLMKRYDGVLHLRSTAFSKEDSYTKANNEARYEDLKQAKEGDERTLQAWVGCSKLRIVDNEPTFEEKVNQIMFHLSNLIDFEKHIEIEKKFLVNNIDFRVLKNKFGAKEMEITQDYLIETKDMETRLRKTVFAGNTSYTMTEKEKNTGIQREEKEINITEDEYDILMGFKDPKKSRIHKVRHCFVYKNQYFELDTFSNLNQSILEVELSNDSQKVELPSFLEIVNDVSTDYNYKNYNIAKRLFDSKNLEECKETSASNLEKVNQGK